MAAAPAPAPAAPAGRSATPHRIPLRWRPASPGVVGGGPASTEASSPASSATAIDAVLSERQPPDEQGRRALADSLARRTAGLDPSRRPEVLERVRRRAAEMSVGAVDPGWITDTLREGALLEIEVDRCLVDPAGGGEARCREPAARLAALDQSFRAAVGLSIDEFRSGPPP